MPKNIGYQNTGTKKAGRGRVAEHIGKIKGVKVPARGKGGFSKGTQKQI